MVRALAGDSTITSDVGIGDSLIATARRLSITSAPGRRFRGSVGVIPDAPRGGQPVAWGRLPTAAGGQ